MSCLAATSPGFLSEYRRVISWAKGVGAEDRRAKHPMDDVDRPLKQRRSSYRMWSSCCSSLEYVQLNPSMRWSGH
jgi:hypothetical protein